jgi:hypothetical protein
MKTLIGLGAGGAALAYWRSLPAIVKVPVIFGAGMLAAAELNSELNQSWFSSQIFAGQGAEGAAKAANPLATLKAVDAGQPVTTAAATAAAQYSGLRAEAAQKDVTAEAAIADPVATRKAMDAGQAVKGAVATAAAQYQATRADATQKEVYAKAAEESEDELLAKKAKGVPLTSTEELRLKEIELKQRELRIKDAEATIKEAEVESAVPMNKWVAKVYSRMARGDGGADTSFSGTLARTSDDYVADEEPAPPPKARKHRRAP